MILGMYQNKIVIKACNFWTALSGAAIPLLPTVQHHRGYIDTLPSEGRLGILVTSRQVGGPASAKYPLRLGEAFFRQGRDWFLLAHNQRQL